MKKELFSQLLDAELSSQEVERALDELLAKPDLQKSWQSVHAMRSALDENSAISSNDFLSKVSASIELEPQIMAPNNIPLSPEPDHSSVVPDNVVSIGRKRPHFMTYIAVAASVAALTMMAYQPLENSTPTIASTQSTQAPISQVNVEQELQSMLVQHGEFTGAAALNGLVAYAKVVNGSTVPGGQ